MLPFGIQPLHLVLVIIIALIIFGPQRLPEIGRGLGKSINEFRKGAKEMTDGFKDEVVKPEDTAAQPAAVVQAPAAPASVTCPSCGTANMAGAAFCNKCGTKLAVAAAPAPAAAATITCPSCSTPNLAGAAFCNKCGTKLAY